MSIQSTPNTVPKDPVEWFQWVQSRLRILERHRHAGPDVSASTSGAILSSVAAGWSVGTITALRVDNVISFAATFTRTGTAIVSPADGNIGNVTIATLLLDWRPAVYAHLGTTHTGSMVMGLVEPTGNIIVSALQANIDWGTSSARSIAGTWIAQRR